MKKFIFPLTVVITLYSCNSSDSSKNKNASGADSASSSTQALSLDAPPAADCMPDSILYLSASNAQAMKADFKTTYVDVLTNSKRKFTVSSLVDAVVIQAFYKALSDAALGYDGVRLYYGATNNKPSQSLFMLAPTMKALPGQNHPNVWGAVIAVTGNSFTNFNYTQAQAKPLIDTFLSKFKEQTDLNDETTAVNKGLSSGVWFQKCVFEKMKAFLDQHKAYQGFRLYAASYPSTPIPAPVGYAYDHQSTVFWVPVDSSGADRWDVLTASSQEQNEANATTYGGLNHGELCPRNCVP